LEVRIEELKTGMLIEAYLGLEDRFATLDQKGCDWLKLNFAGTQTKVIREGALKAVAVENLNPGDQPQQVTAFPQRLKHLTQVSDKLVLALTQQGFSRFEVSLHEAPLAQERHATHQKQVTQTANLVAKAKAGVAVRSQAVKAIESVMDGLAQGVSDLASLEPLVNSIVENDYADAMSALATLKESDHTYGHCVDVGAIFTGVYEKICALNGRVSQFESTQETFLSALLHDVGKSAIPKDILESTVAFAKDSQEMKLLRGHPEKSGQILAELGVSKVAINMATYHHVKANAEVYTSYPRGAEFDDVMYETRLLGIVDVYQALTGRRPYKKSWTAPAAMRYLDALAGVEFDEDVLDDFIAVLGLYPLGSYVVLSDKSEGFVMNVPEKPSRPLVAVLKDATGAKQSPAILIDLMVETGLKISGEIDPVEVFGENALDEFISLKVK